MGQFEFVFYFCYSLPGKFQFEKGDSMFPFKKGDSKVSFKKDGSIQKWEYCVAYVEVDEEQKTTWVALLPNGKSARLSAALAELGESGWEMCGSTQATSPTGAATGLFQPSHWLYFKRPRV